ncbi:MAG: thiamine biosynthesis protein ThiS [Bacillus thermozeamaize]|uniref:Thiamine biosynthesis protein ThiS n=1 Tax=Bacillus thermozeamaize TaxID=230954 RepID=A0A1Y3PGD2_9BACI|nr:MAG: thiamine biosynthesis protein ThiS [Bacillus thermozeamaize]
MLLYINGQSREIPSEVDTVQRLLDHLNIGKKILIVQHNEEILKRENYASAPLREGDRIEIVHFVGGG